jgi:replicative DNA helicase
MTPIPDLGKVPPHDLGIEEAVLGAIILEKPAFGLVRDLLDDQDFYEPQNQLVYKACMDLFSTTGHIDLLTVTDQLRRDKRLEEVGGVYRVTELTSKVSNAAHIETHAAILKQLSLKRKIIRFSMMANAEAYDEDDAFELIEKYQQQLKEIAKFSGATKLVPIAEQVHEVVTEIEQVIKGDRQAGGLPTGFLNLDKIIGAWVPTNLIILAARPGMGKSALALRFCVNQVDMFQVPAALFSLEMSNPELINRLLAMETSMWLNNIRFRKIDEHQLAHIAHKAGKIGDYPLYLIDDCFSLSQIRSKARRLVDEQKVKFMVIDYLQLIHVGRIEGKRNISRENEISYISRELKLLAKELNIPVIALSQLSRLVEQRGGDKRPKLSDLRESGAIEQDADVVMFVYRPEYYGIEQNYDGSRLPTGLTEVIIAKNRNRGLEMAELIFRGFKTDFENYDPTTLEAKLETHD